MCPSRKTNIYEIHKINDPQRRHDLAYVQATLSQGQVFRGRHRRLEAEVTDVLRGAYGLEPVEHAPHWFLSNVFFEATLEWKDPRLVPISERVMEAIQKEPPRHLFEYLMLTPEDVRITAVARFTEGSDKQIEARRSRDANESLSMRRRIHSAMLMVNELDLILGFVRNAGLPEQNETEILRKTCRKLINVAPTIALSGKSLFALKPNRGRLKKMILETCRPSARSSPMPILSLLRTCSQIWPCKRARQKV